MGIRQTRRLLTLTPDGIFYPDSSGPAEVEGIPCIAGHVEIPIKDDSLRERLQAEGVFQQDVFVAGRSGHAQVGIDAVKSGENPVFNRKGVKVPLEVKSHLHSQGIDFLDLLRKETSIRIARLVIGIKQNSLTAAEVESAINNHDILIGSPDHTVNPDGSVTIPVAPFEYRMSKTMLQLDHDVRKEILLHGRNALIGKQDLFPMAEGEMFDSRTLKIMGIPLSTGRYSALIEPEISRDIWQLRAATYLGAFRSTRIAMLDQLFEYAWLSDDARFKTLDLDKLQRLGPTIGLDFFRQLEIWNDGAAVDPHNLKVKVRFYPHPTDQKEQVERWQHYNHNQKDRIHLQGSDTAQTTGILDGAFRRKIFEGVTPDQNMYGKIFTRNGASIVPRDTGSPLLQNQTTLAVAKHTDNRETEVLSGEEQRLIQSLGDTKDSGRMLVCHSLPSDSAHLQELYEAGIRVFLFRSIGIERPEEQNVYLTPSLHQKIWKMTRQGASFFFDMQGDGDKRELREFYKGMWLKPSEKERFDQAEVVINMYGTHKEGVMDSSEESIRDFFQGLIATFGKDKVAITHGKGRGVMEISDRIARELGMFSIGVGISVERIGQGKPNLKPEAVLDFWSESRAYRQDQLDKMVTIPIFNLGGDGTVEEQSITTCSMKIREYLPTPIIFVDPTGEKEHYYEGIRQMGKAVVKGANGVSMGEPWAHALKFYVRSYEEAQKIINDFYQSPCAFWKTAGVPQTAIAEALEKQSQIAAEYDRPIPKFLEDAAKEYLQKES